MEHRGGTPAPRRHPGPPGLLRRRAVGGEENLSFLLEATAWRDAWAASGSEARREGAFALRALSQPAILAKGGLGTTNPRNPRCTGIIEGRRNSVSGGQTT